MNPDAINALKKENELVTIFAAVASAFTALRASTELETEALGAWEPDLLRHKQINETLLGKAAVSGAFKTMADEELGLLQQFIDLLDENGSELEKGFREHFQDDWDILKAMNTP